MPEQRLQRTRTTLPAGYQFGDAVKRYESDGERCLREQRAHRLRDYPTLEAWYYASPMYLRYVKPIADVTAFGYESIEKAE